MRVLFRCDADHHRGAGHVVRCVAFAEAAREAGWDCGFIGSVANPLARALIGDWPLHDAPADNALPALAKRLGADVVHVDSYEFSGDVPFDCVLSNMEDLDYGRRPATLVVDPSPTSETQYRPPDGTHRLFRGAKAIPLRKAIVDAPVHAPSDGPLRVLIMLGGTDARNLTERLTVDWLATGVPSEVHVIGTVDVPGVRVHRPGPEVAQLLGSMDLAISASGTSIWELAHLGVAAAIVQVADNQQDNFEFATSSGFAVGLGNDPTSTLRELGHDRARLAEMSRVGRALLDGAGSSRVVGLWTSLVGASGVSVREAGLDDASLLYAWRNDASVRAVSRSTDELSWDCHLGWVRRTLTNPDRVLTVVQDGTEPIGTVRFDRGGDVWEVSITVAPATRGMGRSSDILRIAEEFFFAQHGNVPLVAEMLPSNPASLRLFQSCGYGGLSTYTGADNQQWHRVHKPS